MARENKSRPVIGRKEIQEESIESKVYVRTKLPNQTEETEQEYTIGVHKFITEPAIVRVSAGVTRSLGEGTFEFLRLDVSISMPCYAEQVNEVFNAVAEDVSVKLAEEQEKYFNE